MFKLRAEKQKGCKLGVVRSELRQCGAAVLKSIAKHRFVFPLNYNITTMFEIVRVKTSLTFTLKQTESNLCPFLCAAAPLSVKVNTTNLKFCVRVINQSLRDASDQSERGGLNQRPIGKRGRAMWLK